MKVLVVDNDADLLDLLTYALRRAGFTVLAALDGEQALRQWQAERPDLVLLESALPRVNGLEVCRRIRELGQTPIILLTKHATDADIVGGFEAGADDCVAKPFSPKQLVARMHAVLRRYEPDSERLTSSALRVGELMLDPEAHRVTKAGKAIDLTPLEFRLLYYLALNAGQVVPYSRMIEEAWGYYGEGTMVVLKTHISHLRRKLGPPRSGPGSITVTLGIGFRLVNSPTRLPAPHRGS
jgi:two-component system OmpR family response regulator